MDRDSRQATLPSGEDGYILDGEVSPNASVARLWGTNALHAFEEYRVRVLICSGRGC